MTQNQNPKKVQQVLEEKFQASNIGVNKIILNINGGNSNFPTNKNSEIQYSLEQPLVLEMGDTVTSCITSKQIAEIRLLVLKM